MVGDVHEVRLPTYINVSKKTRKALNLNIYRNLHHHHLNKQKQTFHDEVKPLLGNIPRAEKIWIHYTIFAPRNGRLDTMNVGSIVDKYFSDTLGETKKIMDDHFGHIVLISFSFGGVRPMDGHAIAKIHILEQEKDSNMRIILDQTDIETALNNYIDAELNINNATGVKLTMEDGVFTAEVQTGATPMVEKPTTKSRGGRPRGSKNKPKEEVMDGTSDDNSEDGSDGTDSGPDQPSKTNSTDGQKTSDKEKNQKPGNLFGDGESPSSESDAKATDKGDTTSEDTSAVKTTKKSSIFDVD